MGIPAGLTHSADLPQALATERRYEFRICARPFLWDLRGRESSWRNAKRAAPRPIKGDAFLALCDFLT